MSVAVRATTAPSEDKPLHPRETCGLIRTRLSGQEIAGPTFAVVAANAWNRLNIGFKTASGPADAKFGSEMAGLN